MADVEDRGVDPGALERLRGLVRGARVVMLTTCEDEGQLHSRPMLPLELSDEGETWFFTDHGSKKVEEIRRHNNVCVTWMRADRVVVASGIGTPERDRGRMRELWNPLFRGWYPRGLDEPGLCLLRVRLVSAEFWDTRLVAPTRAAGFIKAVVQGRRWEPTEREHGVLALRPVAVMA